MKTLVCFVEGPSDAALLTCLLPKLLPADMTVQYQVFQGKQDMEHHLFSRMRNWRTPDSLFVVIRDQDAGDCRSIKEKLAELCRESGRTGWLVRIACRELESFFLGDLAAVETGLETSGLRNRQNQRKFRNPDALGNPAEELERLIGRRYNKLADARAIAPHLDLERNTSRSFNALISGIRKLVEADKWTT